MHELYCLITIVSRPLEDGYARLFGAAGAEAMLVMPAEGTAAHEMLNLLGLEATEKTVFFNIMRREARTRVMHDMVHRMGLEMPNTGISLSVPLSAVAGTNALNALLNGQELIESGETTDMDEMPYSLITVIANRGCSDMVMDAARASGATGGTVLHAKGAGAASAQKFFGLSIADEKELILMVVLKEKAAGIMKAVTVGCGSKTKAHAMCFSMPVDRIAGFELSSDD